MIEVRVRVDQVPDRLVRNGLLRFRDHRQATRLALTAFEHDDVIPHVDGERHIAAGDAVDAVGQLLGLTAGAAGAPPRGRAGRRRGLAGAEASAAARCCPGSRLALVIVASNVVQPGLLPRNLPGDFSPPKS